MSGLATRAAAASLCTALVLITPTAAGASAQPAAPGASAQPAAPGASAQPAAPGASAQPAPGAPTALTINNLVSPLGVEDPQFGWVVSDPRRGAAQAAYEILVGLLPTTGPASSIWDSGRVTSSQQSNLEYGGPALASDTTYYWTVRTWDASGRPGPYARPAHFATGLSDADWQANWVRLGADPSPAAGEQYAYLRKVVDLSPSPITRAVAYVSASSRYELWLNGTLVDRGETYAYPDSQFYQATDVTRALRAGGPNAIGVLAHWGGSGKNRAPAPPGAIVHISVEHSDGTREVVVTDGTWRARDAEWQEPVPVRNDEASNREERIDARLSPLGWDLPGYDDSSWSPVYVVGAHPVAPWTHLVSQLTRIVETPVRPVSVKRVLGDEYVADFGSVVAAQPVVSFLHGSSGRVVAMRAGYLLDPDGEVSTTRGTQMTDMSFQYTERPGRQTFTAFGYLGYRYYEVDAPGETLSRDSITAIARHSAMPAVQQASFTSPNGILNKVWSVAAHSALYGSQDSFVDTPTREQSQFLRDSFNISSTTMLAFGERALTRQALLAFAQSQARYWPDGRINAIYPSNEGARDIPDFTEIYPEWVWQYYEDTGDRSLVSQLYPVLANVAAYVAQYVQPQTGLVGNLAGGTPGSDEYGAVDANAATFDHYQFDYYNTTVNELAVDVFARTAQVAAALGRPAAEVQLQAGREASLAAAVNRRLTRNDGLYVDGMSAGGVQATHASEIANAYAIAYGIVPARHLGTVARYIARLGMQMEPMTAEALVRALHIGGQDPALVRLATDPRDPGWGYIVTHGGTYTWEVWRPSDANGDSMSHAWGANVLVDIQQDLLGVTPGSPGFASVLVRPPSGGIASASGTVPTDRGPIRVSWARAGGSQLHLDITVPANTTATVTLPAPSARSVTESGRALGHDPGVLRIRAEGRSLLVSVGAGSYRFAAGAT